MTDDYKKNVLDYVTGNLETETSQNNSFKSNEVTTNYLATKLSELEITPTYYQVLSTESSSNFIIYGGYLNEDDNTYYGFIAILGANGEVLKIFTEYDSGTKLSFFQRLQYDEDNNIYGIDLVGSNYRFIMLNNVVVETSTGYSCKLRQSYYIPSEANYYIPESFLGGNSFIKKSSGEAVYYMFGYNGSNVMLIKFTINVGSSNEWLYYTGSSLSGYAINYCNFILEKVNNVVVAYIYYVVGNTTLYYDYFDGSSLTRQSSKTFDSNLIKDIAVLNETECYVIVRVNDSDLSRWVGNLYLLENGTSETLIQTISSRYNISVEDCYLNLANNILFVKAGGTAQGGYFRTIYGVYDGTNYIESDYAEYSYQVDIGCVVQNSYGLYKCYTQYNDVLYIFPIVIYDNEYSGASYVDYNSLIPLHSELYSNDNIVFARSLYDKSILNNITTSTVEIPFNYLNDISITQQDLLSETQLPLVSNTNTITKNIYENVFLNFINTLNVIDEDTNTTYSTTASFINTNINTGTQTNYEETMLTKIHINLDSGTIIQNIAWTRIDDTHFQTNFTIYISDTPLSIDFLDENETTIYLTKDITELEVGNTYTITQYLRIE